MFAWFAAYGGTLLVLAAVALVVALVLRSVLRDRKAGKTACGSNCAHCAMRGECHPGR